MTTSTGRRIMVLFFTMLAGTLSAAPVEIQIKPETVIRHSLVRLGDIAEIQDADEVRLEALRQTELFPAPTARRRRTIRPFELRQLLELNGFDTKSMRITGLGVLQAVDTRDEIPGSGQESALGDRVTTRPREESKNAKTAPERALVPAVVVARQAVNTGDVLREVDVDLLVPEKAVMGTTLARNIESVVGLEVTRPLAAGQVIDLNVLRRPVLVQRGQVVSVTAKAAGVRVRTTARATESGSAGDIIRVEPFDNKDNKYAVVVTGPQEAEVLAVVASASDRPATAERRVSIRSTTPGPASDPSPAATVGPPQKSSNKEQIR